MAKFKTDAARKRWLKLQKTKKYAVGGLTDPTMYSGTSMYGANVIPGTDTASIVYQESDPNILAELDQKIADTSVDPGYQITAAEELAADARKEAIATNVGSRALNLAAKKGQEQYVESLKTLTPEEISNLPATTDELMGDSAGGALKQGATAFKTTRDLNQIYQGTASAKQVADASKTTTELLANLSTYGDTTLKTSSAVGSGISAVAKSAGPQLIAQAATYGLDKWYDKVSDDDTLEGQANFTSEEKALSGARGATAGVAALGTASWIAGLAGVSAANAWNPLGWAGLIAAGIGAGVTLLNRKRKAKKAGEAVEGAEESRQRDLSKLQRGRHLEALKDKQYSGFDYGGDVIMPGQYRHGGVKKYQTIGILGYDDTPAEDVQYDRYGLPIGQNLLQSELDDASGAYVSESTNPVGYIPPVIPGVTPGAPAVIEKIDPEYIQTMSDGTKVDMRQVNRTGATIGPSTIPAGHTYGSSGKLYGPNDFMPEWDKIGYVPQGAPPNMQFMLPPGLQGPGNEALQEQLLRDPLTNPATPILAGLAMYGPGAYGAATGTTTALANPVSTLGTRGTNYLTNAIFNPANASTTARIAEGTKGVYNLYGASLVPNAVVGLGGGISDELTGNANLETRLGMAEDIVNLNPSSALLRRTVGGGLSAGEIVKVSEDIASGDILSGGTRLAVSAMPGDQSRWDIGKYTTKIANKYLKKDDSDALFGNLANTFETAPTLGIANPILANPGFGTGPFKTGGMRSLPGGKAVDIGNGATKYVGQTHAQGGIMADPQSEVENNEVEKDVTLADGSKNPYIYSEYLNMDGSKGYKTGGMSIADKAEELARTGAPQSSFDALAIQQEKAAGRDGSRIQGTGMAKTGGFKTKYQTTGLLISKKYPREWYDNIYSTAPDYSNYGTGRRTWYTPDGMAHPDEAAAVEYINRGGMAGWNANDPVNYGGPYEDIPDEKKGTSEIYEMMRGNNLPVSNQKLSPQEVEDFENWIKENTPETEQTTENQTQGGGKTYVSPFDSIEEERAFQDWANEQGVDTRGYGWGKYSDAAWNQLKDQWEARDAEVVDDAPAPKTEKKKNPHPVGSLEWHNWEKGITAAAKYNNDGTIDYDGDPRTSNDVDLLGITDDIGTETGSDVTDDIEETRKEKLRRLAKEANDNGTLLKAAQFIPAIMAFNDKADTMDPAERIGGVPRVHLDRVDMSDQIAANNAQGRAVQRFIDNAGMGTAGFAARMANYAQNQGLNMAVQAEQARINTEIQNSEATANMEVEARNRQIAESNRQARMLVDQFNTESEAATKAQRVSAVQNAASGLLTQWMDQQMLDSQERIKNAIAGQTGIMQREAITNYLDNAYPDLAAGTDAYNAMFTQVHSNMYGNTTNTKKFGGMRNIPRYGYSTK